MWQRLPVLSTYLVTSSCVNVGYRKRTHGSRMATSSVGTIRCAYFPQKAQERLYFTCLQICVNTLECTYELSQKLAVGTKEIQQLRLLNMATGKKKEQAARGLTQLCRRQARVNELHMVVGLQMERFCAPNPVKMHPPSPPHAPPFPSFSPNTDSSIRYGNRESRAFHPPVNQPLRGFSLTIATRSSPTAYPPATA